MSWYIVLIVRFKMSSEFSYILDDLCSVSLQRPTLVYLLVLSYVTDTEVIDV